MSSTKPVKYTRPGPIANEDNEDEVYDVDTLIDTRIRNKVREYLVVWDGWPPEEATWEAEADIHVSFRDEFWTREQGAELQEDIVAVEEEMRGESVEEVADQEMVEEVVDQEIPPVPNAEDDHQDDAVLGEVEDVDMDGYEDWIQFPADAFVD